MRKIQELENNQQKKIKFSVESEYKLSSTNAV